MIPQQTECIPSEAETGMKGVPMYFLDACSQKILEQFSGRNDAIRMDLTCSFCIGFFHICKHLRLIVIPRNIPQTIAALFIGPGLKSSRTAGIPSFASFLM